MTLQESLEMGGWEKEAEDFREFLADVFANTYRGWTDEDLYFRPRDALWFCNTIRARAGLPDMPDHVILGAMSNDRKRGRWVNRLESRLATD